MNTIEEYRAIRKAGVELNMKLFDAFKRSDLDNIGRQLGILRKGVLKFDEEGTDCVTMDHFSDFGIFDYRDAAGLTVAQRYLNNHGLQLSDIEKQLLQAYAQSESSLFSVEIVDQSQFSISLRDLFHENRQVVLTDLAMSQSPIVTKCLIFCRILNINGIQMTSGASFVFYNKDQEKLLKEYKAQLKKALAATTQAKSFIAFAKTSRRFGVSTNYQNVD